MHVIATAGHVDHGKSTLVHRLTGMWPDRLAEEQRRGLTIDLGFAWTEIDGRRFAFVDVPGHERFVANMLAGVGAAPAVTFVVAATEGWMPQSEEHLAAVLALGVQHVLVVISKADLADPGPAVAQVRERLPDAPVVLGTDLDQVRAQLVSLVERLPAPDRDADVRLWVDRSFTGRGAGTVVTGTLAAGTIRVGDELEHAGRRVTVRGLQSLGQDEGEVDAVARVALNLRGVDRQHIGRGDAIRTPGAWLDTAEVDVALRAAGQLHRQLVLHIGSAAVPVHLRPLGTAARLRLARPLPLRVGDIGLLRDPGEHRIAAGIEVLDVRPPRLRRRGAARDRADELATGRAHPPVCARTNELRAMGFEATGQRISEWVVDPQWWDERRQQMMTAVKRWAADHDVAAGMPLETLRQQADLPTAELIPSLLDGTGLEIADGVVLGPDALERAADVLRALPQPFTVSDARRALGTTRRVAVPLLEQLDARQITRRSDDNTRTVV